MPPMGSPDFDARIDLLARTFGIARWRLAFVCRAAHLDTARVRD